MFNSLHQMVHVTDFHNPIRADDNYDRDKRCKKNVADLDAAVSSFCHMHEHKELQSCLNERKDENDD